MTKIYEALASRIQARTNCQAAGNTEWFDKHEEVITNLASFLPSGSGFDSGTKIDLQDSTGEKIVLETSFHHMNENGYYDGWTNHRVYVTPAFVGGFNLRITGRDRNSIKEYIADVFHEVLSSESLTA